MRPFVVRSYTDSKRGGAALLEQAVFAKKSVLERDEINNLWKRQKIAHDDVFPGKRYDQQ